STHLTNMAFQASVNIEEKTYEVTFTSLSLKSLEEKVKEIISENKIKPEDMQFDFKIADANGQWIDNNEKLQTAFGATPVLLYIDFNDKNNDEDVKYSEQDNEKQDDDFKDSDIELEQKEWNEAIKAAHTIVEDMIENKEKGIVVVASNLDQMAKLNSQQSHEDTYFTMMINSDQYMKKQIVIEPYKICSFHSKSTTLDNITIDGCVYIVDCTIYGIGNCHVTQYLIHTEQSVINYNFDSSLCTTLWPIDTNNLMDLGFSLREKSNFDKAIQFFRIVLGVRLDKLGEDHIDVADSYDNLGLAYHEKDEYDIAIKYYKKGLKIRLDKLGEDHIDVANLCHSLGAAYNQKDEYDIAITFHKKALKIRLDKQGEDHIDVALLYNNLGVAYNKKGEYDIVITFHEKALKIRLDKLGEDHIDVASSYDNLGYIYYKKNEWDKAIEYFKKALKIRLNKQGEDHIDVASLYRDLGMSYNEKDKLGEDHIKVAQLYNDLGLAYYKKDEYDIAIEYYKKELKIRLDKQGEDNIDVALLYNNLGLAYNKKGEYDIAITFHEK
ncbi:hypothetical protein RFI_39207, partial [Reticulomyxa filosa]